MASRDHKIYIRMGVEEWNDWRVEYPGIKIDLSGLDLSGESLPDVDLFGADLSRANFSGADLCGADLSNTDLSGANFSAANLYRADLSGADLSGADLSGANLSHADLSGLDLSGRDLSGKDLSNTNLQSSQLIQCDLTGAILTGAKLYGSSRDDWIIRDVKCRYVFWDRGGKHRSPKDRDLAPGEFERLYQTLPTIEYVFQNGMTPLDPLIMDRVVQAIRQQNPEYDIKIDSISARGMAPSIKFSVQKEDQKEVVLAEIARRYDSYVERLETDKERLAALLAQALENNRLQTLLLSNAVPRIGHTVHAGNGAIAVVGGENVTIQAIREKAQELREVLQEVPAKSTRGKQAKDKLLSLVDGVLTGAAKDQIKEAAKQIYELGKDLGPVVVNTAAYAFFKSVMQGG